MSKVVYAVLIVVLWNEKRKCRCPVPRFPNLGLISTYEPTEQPENGLEVSWDEVGSSSNKSLSSGSSEDLGRKVARQLLSLKNNYDNFTYEEMVDASYHFDKLLKENTTLSIVLFLNGKESEDKKLTFLKTMMKEPNRAC